MNTLDIVNLGHISPYLFSGILMLNKFKYYETDTLFYFTAGNFIAKYGTGEWNQNINIDNMNEKYTKIRLAGINKPGLPDFMSPSDTLFFVCVLKNMNMPLVKKNVINTYTKLFKNYGIDVICPTPNFGSPIGIFKDNKFKVIIGAFYLEGIEFPNTVFGNLIKFSWDISQNDIMNTQNMKQMSCWKNYMETEKNTIREHVLLFNEVLETVSKDDYISLFCTQLGEELGLEINNREQINSETTLFQYIEELQSNINWIEDAIHPDFAYLSRS